MPTKHVFPVLPLLFVMAAWPPATAEAAGIERVLPTVRPLFREGNYLEFNYAHVWPEVRGEDADTTMLGGPGIVEGAIRGILDDYGQFSFALKGVLGDRLSYQFVLDEPRGARPRYDQGSSPDACSYARTRDALDSHAITATLAYDVTPNFMIYGGLRTQRTDASASVPFLNGYTIDTDTDVAFGYMLGAGYHVPEIALAIALTYHSKIEHDFTVTENVDGAPGSVGRSGFNTPQSVTLEFQSGVAANTLVFGSVRWVEWTDFMISPPVYTAMTGDPLVRYDADWWTYSLGVGQRLTDNWSGALMASYEPSEDAGRLTTLGPVNGRTTVGAALTYTQGPLELTGAFTYGWFGETENQIETDFHDGDFAALGLRVGYSF